MEKPGAAKITGKQKDICPVCQRPIDAGDKTMGDCHEECWKDGGPAIPDDKKAERPLIECGPVPI